MIKWKKLRINLTGTILILIILLVNFVNLSFDAFALQKNMNKEAKSENKILQPRAELTDDVQVQIPFVVDSLCRIMDSDHSLDEFLEELELLLAGRDTVINVVHLGDSHIQAGFYTGQIMRMLQEAFGNAGRGWIAPFKLAKENEPRDYYITSSTVKDWTVGRCIQNTPKCIWGLGGIGLQTESNKVDFTISMAPNNGAGYDFNEVLFYRDINSIPMLPVGDNSEFVQTIWGTEPSFPNVIVDTFRIRFEVNSIQLYSAVQLDLQSKFPTTIFNTPNCYYGFSLINGKPGILYHSIGQNGAMFVNYTSREYIRQLSLLHPSLLILTLGTNEAFAGKNFQCQRFISQMDQFIQLVKEYLPGTAILMTTPAESFRRTKKGYERNQNISLVAETITDYAQKEGLACFDLYSMTGGPNSCVKWQDANLLGRDRIHFSVDGYYEQGKLLYKALVRLKVNQKK